MNHVSLGHFAKVFARIGFISFGGPAAQIAMMHRELVDERRWVDEQSFLRALNLCHLLPGPEAQQLATWIGWRLHGLAGALIGGLLFILPGAAIMLALSALYAYAVDLPVVAGLFLGIKAAVLSIVVQAVLRIAGRSLKTPFKRWVAILSFVALFFFAMPFPAVIVAAFVAGFVLSRLRPHWLGVNHAPDSAETTATPAASLTGTLGTVAVWLLIWATPMLIVAATLGQDHVLWRVGLFFSQLAVVTFGGAYAVLAYMAQAAVTQFDWVSAADMATGLGLAETTPGPLILVTQFVGFLAAMNAPAPFTPLVAGVLGAALTTWVTFAPCFLWILTFAPWMARLERAERLQGGLATLTAAVVGVIANLSLWFALHVLFARVDTRAYGPLRLSVPEVASIDWRVAVIGVTAAVLLFRFKLGMIRLLGVAGAMGGVLILLPA